MLKGGWLPKMMMMRKKEMMLNVVREKRREEEMVVGIPNSNKVKTERFVLALVVMLLMGLWLQW